MENKLLKLNLRNLQLFAEGGEGAGVDPSTSGESHQNSADGTGEAFQAPQSQSELDALINKATQKALGNAKKGEENRIAEAVKEALAKEKDYAKLSEKERQQREFEESKQAFEAERAQFEREKLVIQVSKDLVDKGLPSELAETFALYGNSEEALKAVGVFEQAFTKAVADKVKETVRQVEPGSSGGASSQRNYGASLAERLGSSAKARPFD